jgi:hypothetical protein
MQSIRQMQWDREATFGGPPVADRPCGQDWIDEQYLRAGRSGERQWAGQQWNQRLGSGEGEQQAGVVVRSHAAAISGAPPHCLSYSVATLGHDVTPLATRSTNHSVSSLDPLLLLHRLHAGVRLLSCSMPPRAPELLAAHDARP